VGNFVSVLYFNVSRIAPEIGAFYSPNRQLIELLIKLLPDKMYKSFQGYIYYKSMDSENARGEKYGFLGKKYGFWGKIRVLGKIY